jgi:CheY-like chemotaxis protein
MTETKGPRTTLEIEAPPDPPTVLLVDDDPAILDGVGEFLGAEGFRVVAAPNGAEALACLRAGLRADVILLDVMMPVMDGWDFRAEQLADPALRKIPVVVISASGFARDTIGSQLKAYDVLPKPIDLGHFLKTLRSACGRGDSDEGASNTAG